jgi:hypothetical protein
MKSKLILKKTVKQDLKEQSIEKIDLNRSA